jgi:HSP20 family molecular chaperone IbpA
MYEDPQDMFREMDTLFSHLFARMTRDFAAGENTAISFHLVTSGSNEPSPLPDLSDIPHRGSSEPVVEVHLIDDEVKVITELPGTTKDAIRLNIQGSSLIIEADNGHKPYYTTAALPPVDPGSMLTSFKNGVLEVTFRCLQETSEKNGS